MKKIMIFLMILSFAFIGTLSAQGIGFGIKGGVNMAKFTGDDADIEDLVVDVISDLNTDQEFIYGPLGGAFVTFNLSDRLAIQTEFLYTVKGGSYEIGGSYTELGIPVSIDGSLDFKMNWLDIPILVVFNLNDRIKIFGGPYLELFLNGKMDMDLTFSFTYEGQEFSESESESEDFESEDITSPGYGVIFGGAFMLGNNLEAEARYALGLTSFDEVDDVINSGIQILLNYYLKK